MSKFTLFLKRCFYSAFIVFPLGFALIVSTWITINAVRGADVFKSVYVADISFPNYALCMTALISLLAIMVFLAYKVKRETLDKKSVFLVPAIVLALGLIPRMILFFTFKSAMIPYSDGRYAWEAAQGVAPERLAVKILQNGWNNFTGILRYFITNFNIEYTTFMFFLFIADALIVLVIYLIAKEIFSSDKISFTAAMLYALNPSMLARRFYMSPDIISQLGIAIATLLIVKLLKEERKDKIIIYALLSGCFTGAANGLKSVARVFVIAVFIVLVLKILPEKLTLKKIVTYALAFMLFVIPSLGVNKIGLKCSSYVLGVECKDLNTWHFINVGLNPYGEGSVAHGEGHYYNHLIVAGVEPNEARDLLIRKLAKDWHEADITVAEFAFIKGKSVWGEDAESFAKLMVNSLDVESMNPLQKSLWNGMLDSMTSCSQVFYQVIILLSFVGVIHIFFRKIENDGAFFISLHTFGFALMLLISEVQSRYKSNIMHLVVILAAVGIWRIHSIFAKEETTATEERETVASR